MSKSELWLFFLSFLGGGFVAQGFLFLRRTHQMLVEAQNMRRASVDEFRRWKNAADALESLLESARNGARGK